jgi:hypothetical protein
MDKKWLIVGGVVAAAGVAALLLFKKPAGADEDPPDGDLNRTKPELPDEVTAPGTTMTLVPSVVGAGEWFGIQGTGWGNESSNIGYGANCDAAGNSYWGGGAGFLVNSDGSLKSVAGFTVPAGTPSGTYAVMVSASGIGNTIRHLEVI